MRWRSAADAGERRGLHRQLVHRLSRALRFWSRLPIPAAGDPDAHAPPSMRELASATPVAGAILGALAALTLVVAALAGLPPMPASILAVAALVLATGAMHEDALADVADGLAGGGTPERRLEIMRDPRLGSYGVSALVLALGLKAALLAGLVARFGPVYAGLGLIAVTTLSRLAALWLLAALPPARSEGLGRTAGELQVRAWLSAALIGLVLAGALALSIGQGRGLVAGLVLAVGAVWLLGRTARRLIGGQTGDVCGAAIALAELALLVGLLAGGPA